MTPPAAAAVAPVASHLFQGSLAAQLKSGTLAAHRALEDAMTLLGPTCSLVEYQRFLTGMAAFHGAAESALPLCLGPEWSAAVALAERRKHHWLQADLRSLREMLPAAGLADVRLSHDMLPPLGNASQGFGVLYVLEGSTLGGHSIQRHLDARLPASWRTAARFLESYGARTGSRWREFRDTLEDFARSGECDREAVVDSARACFERLHVWMRIMGCAT